MYIQCNNTHKFLNKYYCTCIICTIDVHVHVLTDEATSILFSMVDNA